MTMYEYACRNYINLFEPGENKPEQLLQICRVGGGNTRGLLSPAGIVFKGSGFYKTDHASGSVGGENGHAKSNGHVEPGKEAETKTSGESKSSESSQGKAGENQVATEAK